MGQVILAVIVFSSLTLAVDGPMNDPASQTSRVLVQIDNAATVLFIFEMVLKMAAFGFFVTKPTIGCSAPWSAAEWAVALLFVELLQAQPGRHPR